LTLQSFSCCSPNTPKIHVTHGNPTISSFQTHNTNMYKI
jgi:hypothetical protein